ncbi:uncharacterized protein LOC131606910 [Vicia villosa]|uniref:uncharacterized protein LOC131606910 n=1 Tax=Vicia villosa TaxID=3911 RepID=UPI00273C102E|nr:uncharacterized protein LOC131606910 [Vicia villosa]
MDVVVQRPISLHSFSQNVKDGKSQLQRRSFTVSSSLPETAVSVAVAATFVGAAATLLVKRSKASEPTQLKIELKDCEDCGGSGICSACKGEGFVLRKRSEAIAQKARDLSKNMATRFTDGLPKKWSYCTKCTSGRSCSTCGGSGKLNL